MSAENKKIFGLWINDYSISAVEMVKNKFGVRIMNYSLVDLEPEVIENGCIVVNPGALKTALNKLLLEGANGPFISRNAIIALPEEKTFSHLIEIPKEKAKDRDYIMDVAKDLIPIELDEAATDYSTIKPSADGKSLILNFVAAQANIINPLITTLKEVGISVVGVDISSNCLMRAYNNIFNQNSDGYLVASLELEETSINIGSAQGDYFSDTLPIGGKQIAEKIKTILNVATSSEAKDAIKCIKKGDAITLTDEQKKEIEINLSDYFTKIKSKTVNLDKVFNNDEAHEVRTIYPTGCFNQVPGFEKVLKETFPNAEIKNRLEYLQNDAINEHCYIEAIGLALKPLLEDQKNDLNLLPQSKQEELKVSEILPKFKRYFIEISLLLSASMLLSGMYLAKTFVNYKVSEQKTVILNEKALNPYLTEMVKAEREKQQSNNQVLDIVTKAVPVNRLIADLDSLNDESIAMINITFNTNDVSNKNQLRVRAKASSRAETELFVAKLGEISYYNEIISPLSNLVGKGDRFINVDLSVDTKKLTEAYRAALEVEKDQILNEPEEAPSAPSVTEAEKPDESTVTESADNQNTDIQTEDEQQPSNPTAQE